MISFLVKPQTPALSIEDGKEWYSQNFKRGKTKKEHLFFAEDVRIDPLGIIGCGPQYKSTIGGDFARKGYYAFERDGNILIVHQNYVECG